MPGQLGVWGENPENIFIREKSGNFLELRDFSLFALSVNTVLEFWVVRILLYPAAAE